MLVVDDGSTDDTGRARARPPAPRSCGIPFNLGIGGAVQSGFVYALEHGYDYMVQVDGDGQHCPRRDPEARRRRWTSDPALDMVCGSRFLTEERGYPAPISRRTGIHLFAFLLSRIVGQRVSDPTSGFRLYNRRGIAPVRPRLPARLPRGRGGADGALPPAADARGARCGCSQRGGGVSSIRSGKSVYYMIKVLLAIFVGLVRARPVPEPGDEAPVAATHGI